VKSELDSLFDVDTELELIQIDCYGVMFGILRHFFIHSNPIENTRDPNRAEND
jgi:hypothetical protein